MSDFTPKSTPMPQTTKKKSKRRKMRTRSNSGPSTQGNPIAYIYQEVTEANQARIATPEQEKRLSAHGPSTSVRFGGMQFIW